MSINPFEVLINQVEPSSQQVNASQPQGTTELSSQQSVVAAEVCVPSASEVPTFTGRLYGMMRFWWPAQNKPSRTGYSVSPPPKLQVENSQNVVNKIDQTQQLTNSGFCHLAPVFEQIINRLPGEQIIVSIDATLLREPAGASQKSFNGVLCLTNYKLQFRLQDDPAGIKSYEIDHMLIQRCERQQENINGSQQSSLLIETKDSRRFLFKFSAQNSVHFCQLLVDKVTVKLPIQQTKLPAFSLKSHEKSVSSRDSGWDVYDIKREFKRMQLPIQDPYSMLSETDQSSQPPFKYLYNQGDQMLCSTYPQWLVVPEQMSPEEIQGCARFRSRERIPALTFGMKRISKSGSNQTGFTTLWRCSQCKTGFMNRSADDERMLKLIGSIGIQGGEEINQMHIYDARPFMNAVGNKLAGKGFENTTMYTNSEIFFLDIHNIHKVRDSFQKIVASSLSLADGNITTQNSWFKDLDNSQWLIHISSILVGASKISTSMRQGSNVLVHCSDGWDRTSQLVSLAQIFLEPYYRTMEGFAVLVEKDWVQFGHQFKHRLGHGSGGSLQHEVSPVFLQFLDCVHQLLEQFPVCFEFKQIFLVDLAIASYNCLYGTFLCDSYKELISENDKIRKSTMSVWSTLLSQSSKEKYKNPFFKKVYEKNKEIQPICLLSSLRFWDLFFLRGSKNLPTVDSSIAEYHESQTKRLARYDAIFEDLNMKQPQTEEDFITIKNSIAATIATKQHKNGEEYLASLSNFYYEDPEVITRSKLLLSSDYKPQ